MHGDDTSPFNESIPVGDTAGLKIPAAAVAQVEQQHFGRICAAAVGEAQESFVFDEHSVAGLGLDLDRISRADPQVSGNDVQVVALRVTAPRPRVRIDVAWRAQDAGPATLWFAERLHRLPLR